MLKMLKTNKNNPGLLKISKNCFQLGTYLNMSGTKTKIIVRKPKSNTLTISVWQKHKKTISDLSVHKLIHKYAFGQIVTHHVYVVQAKTKKLILSVMENSFLFLKRLVELSKEALFG